jgi:hypothetical protein
VFSRRIWCSHVGLHISIVSNNRIQTIQLYPSKTVVAVERKMAVGGDGIGGQFCWRLLGPRDLTVGAYSFLS